MISKTKGIVLKKVKYRDSSAVVTIYTELFGLQSYLVNGVFGTGKKFKGYLYQPGSMVELEAYHNSLKNLQRIKEITWGKVYTSIFSDVMKHTSALLILELLQKSLKHEEKNEILYDHVERTLLKLDSANLLEAANIPIIFTIGLSTLLGFQIKNNFCEVTPYFDLQEGAFVHELTNFTPEADIQINSVLSELLNTGLTGRKVTASLNGGIRKKLLFVLEQYYRFHIEGFTELKTLRVSIF